MTKSFTDQYEIQTVGASYHTEWWIPAADLEDLNGSIVGSIEVVGELGTNEHSPETDPSPGPRDPHGSVWRGER